MQIKQFSTPATAFQDCERCPSAEILKTENKEDVIAMPTSNERRLRVSFNPKVYVRETLHSADYTDEEKVNSWYQKDEMAQIKDDMVAAVRMMIRGELLSDTREHCSRGLEFRSREGANQRKMNKFRALEAVLDEQDEQIDAGIFNDNAISLVYQSVSLRCINEAHKRGIRDAVDVHGRLSTSLGVSTSGKAHSTRKRIHQILRRNNGKPKSSITSIDI